MTEPVIIVVGIISSIAGLGGFGAIGRLVWNCRRKGETSHDTEMTTITVKEPDGREVTIHSSIGNIRATTEHSVQGEIYAVGQAGIPNDEAATMSSGRTSPSLHTTPTQSSLQAALQTVFRPAPPTSLPLKSPQTTLTMHPPSFDDLETSRNSGSTIAIKFTSDRCGVKSAEIRGDGGSIDAAAILAIQTFVGGDVISSITPSPPPTCSTQVLPKPSPPPEDGQDHKNTHGHSIGARRSAMTPLLDLSKYQAFQETETSLVGGGDDRDSLASN